MVEKWVEGALFRKLNDIKR